MNNQVLTFLEWDSNFFKKKIYRLDLKSDISLSTSLEFDPLLNWDLIYIFSDQKLQLEENENFFLADEKVIFTKPVEDISFVTDQMIRSVEVTNDQLFKLAFLSGAFSRFNLDKKLSSEFKKLYGNWLEKSINREIASEVLVYVDNKEQGFITIKKNNDQAVIGLIAVDTETQGQNIGSKLLLAAEAWCAKNGVKEIDVATQLSNLQACNFYKKNNYTKKNITYIYHNYKK